MEEKQYNLQAYADEHCGGDRFRAIYELISGDVEGALDPYVDGMTRAEANFAFHYLSLVAIQAYGGKKHYRNEVKINILLEKLGQTEETVKATKSNPFVKRLWIELAKLLAAILLPIAAMFLFSLSAEIVAIVESVLIGLQALKVAEVISLVLQYRKLKKLIEKQPPMKQEIDKPSYEVCLAMFQQNGGAVSVKETESSLRKAKDEQVLSWLLLPVYSFLSGVLILLAYGWQPVGGILSFFVLFTFGIWRMRSVLKTMVKSKEAVENVDVAEGVSQLEQRQSAGALSMLLLLAIYFLTTFIDCAVSLAFVFR